MHPVSDSSIIDRKTTLKTANGVSRALKIFMHPTHGPRAADPGLRLKPDENEVTHFVTNVAIGRYSTPSLILHFLKEIY